MLPFLIAGITIGSVYGLAGVGLVLTYKTSGIFNFAHGALATISAYVFYTLYVSHHVPWPVAAFVSVLVVGPGLGFILERIGRGLAQAPLATRIVATVGVLMIVQATIYIIYGAAHNIEVPQFLPTRNFTIAGTVVSTFDVVIVAIGLLATAGLYLYFRYARTGVAMRAVVDNPSLLDLAGTSPTSVRRLAWVIGVCFVSVSGVMLAPLVTLNADVMTLLVVQAFGAAAIGRFSSLPMTYAGGLLIGIAASIATKFFTTGLLASLPAALPFAILFVVLLTSRRGRLAEATSTRPPHRPSWRAPAGFQVAWGAVLLVGLLFVPSLVGFHLTDWTLFLTTTILFLSLGLLVRTSGQVSLAHVSFMAIGAAAFPHLAVDHKVPWALALVLTAVIVIPVGALLAIPAIRLSGLYLALATFGFGVVLAFMFYTEPYMFDSNGSGLAEPRPSLAWLDINSDKGFYYLVLAITVAVTLGVVALNRSRLGRLLRALADSPRGLATAGASVNVTRVLVFCISAALAAVAGALSGAAQGLVTGDSFPPLLSLTYFAVVLINAGGEPWYAVLGAAGLALIPSYLTNPNTTNWLELVFGVFSIVYAFTPDERRGAPAALARAIDRLSGGLRLRRLRAAPAVVPAVSSRVPPADLEVVDLRVRFGGILAVNRVNLKVGTGRITGLIGPNGAGKTTTFNAVSGLLTPAGGQVTLDGRRLKGLGAAARARRGLGRTFQRMELFDSLTVAENVEMGAEASRAAANPLTHFLSGPGERTRIAAAAAESMAICGITDLRDRTVGNLSTGQRRLVELARCLAGPYRLLLLDEPSSGLDRGETLRFGQILRRIVAERGVGILLVEHDMTLVHGVCDYVYVLDFGQPIFEGTTGEVMASPIVRSAYLGAVEIETAIKPAQEQLVSSAG